ncbi:MAG TPA: O-antigen ligase family protein [Vicinamibacterales bacterium]|nr:O-antigen ligase family protein [Vicinamibacterales bacterium]
MLRTLFILSILVPGFVLSLRNRYIALLMYLWFALFRPQDWMWIDITSLRVSMVLGAVLVLPALTTGLFPNVTNPMSIGMMLFLGCSLVTQSVATVPDIGWTWIDFMARLFLASMMMMTLVTNERRLAGVVAVISGSLAFHAAKAGLAFVLGGGMRFADGLAGAFVDNNGYALGTVMIIPLLIAAGQGAGVLYNGRWLPWIRRAVWVAVPLCVFAVIGTYSRGGFVSLAAAALAFVLVQRRPVRAVAALLGAVTIVLLIVPIPQSYVDRLHTMQTYKETGEESALSRWHFWAVGLRMVEDNPLGVGLRQYEQAYDKYDFSNGRYGHHRAVHNSHVQVLAEIGYGGAAVWLGLFGIAFFTCFRVRARSKDESLDPQFRRFLWTTANGLIVSMFAFIVGGSFLSLALNDVTWLTFGMVGALGRVAAAAKPVEVPALHAPSRPLAFQAIDAYGSGQVRA